MGLPIWLFQPALENNTKRFRDWPGAARALHASIVDDSKFVRGIRKDRVDTPLARGGKAGFEELVDLYALRIEGLFTDNPPSTIVVCIPEELADLRVANPTLTETERRALERLQADDESEQMALFQPTPEELKAARELRSQADDLLFRTFYRALKARVMSHPNAVPIQVIRRETIDRPENVGQSGATRAWNLATSIYYKAGGLPWRPGALPTNTCFVGISFHHLKRRSGSLVYASLAQAFSSDVEPFALKGAMIDHQQRRDRQPYLTEQQASDLLKQVLDQYEARAGVLPDRIVVHKTSGYQPEELKGFEQSYKGRVPATDMVWIRPTAFRLIRRGMQEPWRGTFCAVGSATYLFTSGYVPRWSEYPGPHIPAPLEIGSAFETDLRARAEEILALTKMNWNSTDGIARFPITISFARKVGALMTELPDGQDPNPSYKFYM